MIPPRASYKPENMETIDSLARGVQCLQERLLGGERITARELRGLWGQRLRPFWRLQIEIYRAMARRFLEHGDNYLASEAADEAGCFFGDDAALILTRALATARSGAPLAAQELLEKKKTIIADAEEAKSLMARTFKDLWKTSGEEGYLRKSFDLYHLDYMTTKGDRAFPGVNAASTALFLGRAAEAKRIAAGVLALLAAPPAEMGYWEKVTRAECLLVDGQIEPARAAYANAAGGANIPPAHLATTRAQTRIILRHLGHEEAEFDPCFPLPGVIAFTGHRIDAPDRASPRFPDARAPEVKERIRQAVAQMQAGFGYSAAASGADILFLEVMQEAGLETYVHLPLPEEDFVAQSVEDPVATGWLARYRAVTANATEFTCEKQVNPLAFTYGNLLLFGAGCQHARELGSEIRLLAVWDGRPGDGAGGAADYIQMAREMGRPVEIIDVSRGTPGPAATQKAPADSPELVLSILSLSISAEDEERTRLADVLRKSEVIHREVLDRQVRLFFDTPAAAAQAALAIAGQTGSALGLHTGPVWRGKDAITGGTVIRGEHAGRADKLAALEPADLIYTSHAFASLLGLHPLPGACCEFLGFRALDSADVREPIFRLRSAASPSAPGLNQDVMRFDFRAIS